MIENNKKEYEFEITNKEKIKKLKDIETGIRKNTEKNEEIIKLIIKDIKENMLNIKNLDEMSTVEKIRAGVPMRLKRWLNDMFIIYYYGELLVIIKDKSISRVDNISIILSHNDDEWEIYKLPKNDDIKIKERDYKYFIDNIYNILINSDSLNLTEKSTVLHMKYILEKLCE